MAYIIKYYDITTFNRASNTQMFIWNSNISDIKTKLETFTNMESFTGDSAESIKAYIAEVNDTIITSFEQIFLEFQSRYILYKDGFYKSVDENEKTNISEEILTDLKTTLNSSYSDFLDIRVNQENEVAKIQDLVSGFPASATIESGYETTEYKIQSTLDAAGNYEYEHLRNDFSNLESLMANLTSFCNHMLVDGSKEMKSYQAGTVLGNPYYVALSSAVDDAAQARNEISAEVAVATEAERVRDTALLAQERITQGWVSFLQNGLIMAGAVSLIVVSAGTLAPAVVPMTIGITGMTAGGSLVLASGSSIYESGHNFLLGQAGDITTVAYNPMRDGLFHGNQEYFNMYYTGALGASAASGFAVGGYGVYTAATSAGYNGLQAFGAYTGRVFITSASGAISGYGGYSGALMLGVDEPYAQFTGMVTGILGASLANWGFNKADKAYNLSGTNRKPTTTGYLGDSMSPEDAAKYDEFWRKSGIGSDHTYNEFIKNNPGSTVDDYLKLVNGQSPWPDGYTPQKTTLKPGDTFEMALNKGQPVNSPGKFGTTQGTINNVEYTRNNLAIKVDWKDQINTVGSYEVKPGIELPGLDGPVGPQIDLSANKYLPGGAYQVNITLPIGENMMDYVKVIGYRKIY